MWHRISIVGIVIGLCLSACAEIVGADQWDGSDIMGTGEWHLVALNGTPVDRSDVTIQYENLNLAGHGFCADFRIAPVSTSADSIRIDTVATPPHECAANDRQHEDDYIAALIATTKIAAIDNTLVFTTADGQPVLVFAP